MNEQGHATTGRFFHMSTNGSRVLYGVRDIRELVGSTRRLVVPFGSTGVDFVTASADGTHVVFESRDRLTTDDTDDRFDLYERFGSTTRLVSIGPSGGNGAVDVCALRASSSCHTVVSAEGGHVVFHTRESLVPEDIDANIDVYVRAGVVTSLVSTGPAGGNGAIDTTRLPPWTSADGSHIFFYTEESLVVEDTDTDVDAYERVGGTTRLVSTGPASSTCPFNQCGVQIMAVRPDGLTVYFITRERLVAGAPDPSIYKRSGGETTLVSRDSAQNAVPAVWEGISADGERLYFRAGGELWVREQGTTTSVSGPQGSCEVNGEPSEWPCFGPDFLAESADGSRVFFSSSYQLVVGDEDACPDPFQESPPEPCTDIYQFSFGTRSLVSTGAVDTRAANARFGGISQDGARVFFEAGDALVPADSDEGVTDVYERAGGVTTMLAPGPDHPHTNFVFFEAASPDGRMVLLETWRPLIADTNGTYDLYAARLSGPGHPRPKGATPTYVSLVPAYSPCTAPDRTHGPPLAHGSCSSPDQVSTHLTVGTFDANGQPANSIGTVRYGAASGNPATPADEADVRFYLRLGDVRRASDLSDYTGELELRTEIRLTDRASGPGADERATVEEFDFPVAVPCAATADTTIGGLCEIATTAEAIMPGAVTEGARSIWELGQISVNDGGPDGLAATQDNTLFAVQGVFVP